jgi:hypothetical protein
VAVVPRAAGSRILLRQLLGETRFGDDAIRDFLAVARGGQTA